MPGARPPRSDPDLLVAAIDASGLSARRFAMELLTVDERTVRRWLAGDRELAAPVRVLCAAIIADPAVAEILRAAAASLEPA
jgi:DNA-binding transcriptional regulator YiaG